MKQKIIYALGYFDGVHLGHKALLAACRVLAKEKGCNCGAVTFSSHPQQLLQGKNPRLINTNEDREELLLSGVDTVLELAFTPELQNMQWHAFCNMLVEKHHAAGFVCGTDFRFGKGGEGTALLLQNYCLEKGLYCKLVEQVEKDGIRVSSTHIRSLLEQGDLEQANRYLGHSHILSGTVCHGKALGRTIGIPTANLSYPRFMVQLPYGVYATRVTVEGKTFPAVTNVGNRPTVNGENVTVESYLLGFKGDLYGKNIQVEFLRFVRKEQKFESLAALQQQIRIDIENCK